MATAAPTKTPTRRKSALVAKSSPKPKKPPVPKIKIPKQCCEHSPWLLNLIHPTVAFSQAEKGRLRQQVPEVGCLEDLPNHEQLVGFIYRITDRLTGKVYIGQKSVVHKTKKKASAKAKAAALALNPRSRISVVRGTKQSDWLCYWGSSRPLQQDVLELGGKRFCREIIDLCQSKKYLAFSEVEQMFKHNVLRSDTSYNENILGRFYRRDVQNLINHESD